MCRKKRGELIKESNIFVGRQIPQGVVIPGVAGDEGIEEAREGNQVPLYHMFFLHFTSTSSHFNVIVAFTFELTGREDHMFNASNTAVHCRIISDSAG